MGGGPSPFYKNFNSYNLKSGTVVVFLDKSLKNLNPTKVGF